MICSVNAQIETIKLLENNKIIKINKKFTPVYSIYVDKNNSVFFDKRPIQVHEIAKKLSYYRYKLPFEYQTRIKVILYIDKGLKYSILDKIKTELANCYLYNIAYKTNSIEDEEDSLRGINMYNHQSFYHLKLLNKHLTKEKEAKNKRFNDSLFSIAINKKHKKKDVNKNLSFLRPKTLAPPMP